MAKRRRLPNVDARTLQDAGRAPETKSLLPDPSAIPVGVAPRRQAPIADMAGAASAAAALEEVAGELRDAREGGRLLQALPLSRVDPDYLVRDRVVQDDEAMATLIESLRQRGQQTPIEVVALDKGRFGLISGSRRLQALKTLLAETGEERFATVLAIQRQPEGAAEAYLAMVEENEIRADLCFYERARIVARAVEQKVYPTHKAALLALFASASRARRSKIRSFLPIVAALDGVLRYPAALTERLGLRLSRALQEDATLGARLRAALQAAAPTDEASETAVIKSLLSSGKDTVNQSLTRRLETDKVTPIAPGLELIDAGADGVTLRGDRVNADFRARLIAWLKSVG